VQRTEIYNDINNGKYIYPILLPLGFCSKKTLMLSLKKTPEDNQQSPGAGLGRGDHLFLSMRPDTRKTQRGEINIAGKCRIAEIPKISSTSPHPDADIC
jgi:hypothetical protein